MGPVVRATRRLALVAVAFTLGLALPVSGGLAQQPGFPQVKINHIDASQAPKIRVYFSLLGQTLRSANEDQIQEIALLKNPERGTAKELFRVVDGDVVVPRTLPEAEQKRLEDNPPEILPAIDAELGASIVVVVPGFQADEYRTEALGERSRNGAGLFFRQLGGNNRMNVVWYNDQVWTYVYTMGRTNRLTQLSTQLAACERWERDKAEAYGLGGPEPADAPLPNQAECGLTTEYGDLADIVRRQPYVGFWPQLWGIRPTICADIKEGELPVWETRGISRTDGLDEDKPLSNPDGLNAMDVALQMLARDGQVQQPRILILTGDGRDGYINRYDDCRVRFNQECSGRPDISELGGNAQRRAQNECVDNELNRMRTAEQTQFANRLERWIGLAKAAGIRIYSVVHPTAEQYQAERLEVLAWRTGGTARIARDAEEVVSHYEDLISELNNQFVVTFVDDEATPNAKVEYRVETRIGNSRFRSRDFSTIVPPRIERPFLSSFQEAGESKLGKAGFLAVLIVVALVILLVLVKLFGKLLKSGGGVAKKAAKGDDKAKAKLKAKAKKDAEKRAKAKAKAKEKLKKKMKG